MHKAAARNEVDKLKGDVNELDKKKRTPLHHAAEADALEGATALLERGARMVTASVAALPLLTCTQGPARRGW
jgi:hypothetical protein